MIEPRSVRGFTLGMVISAALWAVIVAPFLI